MIDIYNSLPKKKKKRKLNSSMEMKGNIYY